MIILQKKKRKKKRTEPEISGEKIEGNGRKKNLRQPWPQKMNGRLIMIMKKQQKSNFFV